MLRPLRFELIAILKIFSRSIDGGFCRRFGKFKVTGTLINKNYNITDLRCDLRVGKHTHHRIMIQHRRRFPLLRLLDVDRQAQGTDLCVCPGGAPRAQKRQSSGCQILTQNFKRVRAPTPDALGSYPEWRRVATPVSEFLATGPPWRRSGGCRCCSASTTEFMFVIVR